MSDETSDHRSAAHERVWAALAARSYALTSDRAIGLPEKFRQNFRDAYFNPWTLRHDEGDWPIDRQRARDVIRYQWSGTNLQLQRHDLITITDRAGILGQARTFTGGAPRGRPGRRDGAGLSSGSCQLTDGSPTAHSGLTCSGPSPTW